MSNEIILRSAFGKVNQVYYLQPCPNPRTGRLPDCVKPIKGPVDNSEMILSEDDIDQMSKGLKHFIPADAFFEIVDGTVFNLDDIVDKAKWEAIEHCTWIAKSRSQRDQNGNLVIDGNTKKYGNADLYVERPGELTKVRMDKKQIVFQAMQYIYEDSETERIKKCRVLGRNLNNAIPADILDFLIEKAEKDPRKILELYEGEDWKMQLFLIDAVDRGVIRKSDGIYKYDDKMLGGSLESTVTFLRDIRYKKILDSIKRETYPELQPKQDIAAMKDDITKNIPYFGEDVKEDLTTPPKKGPTKK